MSEQRSRSRSAPRRSPSAPRTAPRRPARSGGSGTAILDRVEERPSVADPDEPSTRAETPPPSRSRRAGGVLRDRRAQRERAPRHRLLLACTAVLGLGLIGVLLLNTIISQGAFRQHELEVALILTSEEEEALARAVQQAEAPLEVEKRARALGMVPAAAPAFLRLSDGAVLGEPVPAPEPTGRISFKGAPGIQPTPKPSASASPSEEGSEAQDDAGAAGTTPGAGLDDTGLDDDAAADPAADPGVAVPTAEAGTAIDPALDPATGLDPAATGVATTPSPATSATPSPATGSTPSSPEVNP